MSETGEVPRSASQAVLEAVPSAEHSLIPMSFLLLFHFGVTTASVKEVERPVAVHEQGKQQMRCGQGLE